jgi:hypothetical protein
MGPLVVVGVFIFSFLLGFSLYEKLSLPFSNPWNIAGPLALARYNPNSNILRFVFLIIFPSLILFFLRTFFKKKFLVDEDRSVIKQELPTKNSVWNYAAFLFFFAFIFVVIGSIYSWHHQASSLDNFHEGLTLGPAIDYLHGKAPYKETVFLHGVFENPLRAVLAFKIFGQSIASVRTFISLTDIGTIVLLLVSLLFLFWGSVYLSLFAFFSYLIGYFLEPGNIFFNRISGRDIPFFLVIIIAALIQRWFSCKPQAIRKKTISVLLFFLVFIPTVSFACSVDRGLYLSGSVALYVLLLYVAFLKTENSRYVIPIVAGYIAGIVAVGFFIQWAYYDFIKFVFIIMPQYKDLMDGLIYPFRKIQYLIPVIMLSADLYWLLCRYQSFFAKDGGGFFYTLKLFFQRYSVEFLLLFLSAFYFKGVLGRADHGHIYTAVMPTVMLTIYIIGRHYVMPFIKKLPNRNLVSFVATAFAAIMLLFLYLPRFNPLQWYRFPLGIRDEQIISRECLEAASFVKKNLNENEYFMTLTSEGSWYYFIDKPSPTRFSVLYFALPPFYQEEVVNDLKKKNVKFILYKSGHWVNYLDGVSTEERFPIIVDYVKKNYSFFKNIGDNELWIKNDSKI